MLIQSSRDCDLIAHHVGQSLQIIDQEIAILLEGAVASSSSKSSAELGNECSLRCLLVRDAREQCLEFRARRVCAERRSDGTASRKLPARVVRASPGEAARCHAACRDPSGYRTGARSSGSAQGAPRRRSRSGWPTAVSRSCAAPSAPAFRAGTLPLPLSERAGQTTVRRPSTAGSRRARSSSGSASPR